MNKTYLIKRKANWRKGYRSAFFCTVLVVMAMMLMVMLAILANQPVDQKAVAQAWAPLIVLLAAITGICHFFHGVVEAKLKALEV